MSRRCAGVPGPERASRVLRAGLDGTDRLALKHNVNHDQWVGLDGTDRLALKQNAKHDQWVELDGTDRLALKQNAKHDKMSQGS